MNLTVKAVVEQVDGVLRLAVQHDEPGLALLHGVLLGTGGSGDGVDVGHRLVRGVGDDLAGRAGVHALALEVGAHVGVVEVDLVTTAEVLDAVIVDFGLGRTANQQGSADHAGSDCLLEVL
jgi:hypothetical protein